MVLADQPTSGATDQPQIPHDHHQLFASQVVTISAQHVVVTSSLGALKAEEVCFDPPLPWRKVRAVQRLGFGTVDKARGGKAWEG